MFGLWHLNLDLMADIKIGLPFVPLGTVALAVAGICVDVCAPRSLRLRPWLGRTVETRFPRPGLTRVSASQLAAGGFPFLADASRCDGCLDCVRECPVSALNLRHLVRPLGEPVAVGATQPAA